MRILGTNRSLLVNLKVVFRQLFNLFGNGHIGYSLQDAMLHQKLIRKTDRPIKKVIVRVSPITEPMLSFVSDVEFGRDALGL